MAAYRRVCDSSVICMLTANNRDQLRNPTLGDRVWRRGVVVSGVCRMNEVNARRARLVPGWATVFGRVYHLGM